MKKVSAIIITLISALTLTACKPKSPDIPENGDYDITDVEDGEAEDGENIEPEETSETEQLYDAVLTCGVEFPHMIEIMRDFMPDRVGELSMYAEYAAYESAISVYKVEILILKPVDGKASESLEALQIRLDSLKAEGMYYPQIKAAVDAALIGSKNGITYLICHEEAAAIEEALLNAL